jgi:hypothetical protein
MIQMGIELPLEEHITSELARVFASGRAHRVGNLRPIG